jgi:hypothetical protein
MLLQHNPTLEFHLICKLCHELRAAQHHMMALWHKDALNRLALFLVLFARQMHPEHATPQIYLRLGGFADRTRSEQARRPFDQLCLPCRDLGRMHVMKLS